MAEWQTVMRTPMQYRTGMFPQYISIFADYYEYMDELKGYYWSDDYEEKAKTKTFKQLLDEPVVAGTEVHFDTDK